MSLITKTPQILSLPPTVRPLLFSRLYATQNSLGTTAPQPKRKPVTVFNDDGRVAWGNLSAKEKVARTTQQSFNGGLIALGVVLTGGVAYVMYSEVFSSDSKVTHFNRAVDQVKRDPRCTELLGPGSKITAYGEPTWNKWARARPITSNVTKDNRGDEHLVMHFNVDGPLNKGVVSLHMTKKPSQSEYEYKYLALDVKGHQRIYLENADTGTSGSKGKMKMFGVSWN